MCVCGLGVGALIKTQNSHTTSQEPQECQELQGLSREQAEASNAALLTYHIHTHTTTHTYTTTHTHTDTKACVLGGCGTNTHSVWMARHKKKWGDYVCLVHICAYIN